MYVSLRAVVDADLPIFFVQQADAEAVHMAAFTSKDPADGAAFDAFWTRIRGDRSVYIQTVLADGEVAGSVLRYVDDGHPEVSYWLGREYWGTGIATLALGLFLVLLEERPIYARAAKDNYGSIRVLEKCGFTVQREERGFANARNAEIAELVLVLG